jgi:mono/diheme cytochrome c family protein
MHRPHRAAWAAALVTVALVPAAPAAGARDLTRGKYLVTRVAMCGQCHTPHDEDGAPEPGRDLQGAALPFGPLFTMPWSPSAPAIAGLPAGWSEAALVKLLTTGEGRFGKPLAPPMPQFRMTKQDAEAVVAYLKSLAPAQEAGAAASGGAAAKPR